MDMDPTADIDNGSISAIDELLESPKVDQPTPAPTEEPSTSTDTKSPTAKLTSVYSTKLPDGQAPIYNFSFSLPSVTFNEMVTRVKNLDESKLETDDPLINKWKKVVNDSTETYTPNGMYTDNFTTAKSDYEQGFIDPSNPAQLLTMSSINLKDKSGDLRGEAALLKLSKHLGLGDLVKVPLPHSGIWVTIKPPSEKDLIDFYNSLFKDKIALGRSTAGFTLSNFSVYVNSALVDFIISHIHNTNIIGLKVDSLKDHIYIQDLHILAWGFASSIYPIGFDYQRACLSNPGECSYVAHENINLHKLLWTDNSALTEYQRLHMLEYRPNTRTLDQLTKYKEEHVRVKNSSFTTDSGIKFNLKTPTLQEHFRSGTKWVDYIISSIDSLIIAVDEKSQEDKEKLLEQYVKASILRQYNHFISSIDIGDSNISDKDTLDSSLDLLSSDEKVREVYTKEINSYVANNTISLIGIPTFKCPTCSTEQNPNPINDGFVEVIPMDVIEIFFGLISLKITRLIERAI